MDCGCGPKKDAAAIAIGYGYKCGFMKLESSDPSSVDSASATPTQPSIEDRPLNAQIQSAVGGWRQMTFDYDSRKFGSERRMAPPECRHPRVDPPTLSIRACLYFTGDLLVGV
jgi:hypothetical protein